MPDITMCFRSSDCPLAQDCRRAKESGTKPNDQWQAYAAFLWTENDAGVPHCDGFWPNPHQEAEIERP